LPQKNEALQGRTRRERGREVRHERRIYRTCGGGDEGGGGPKGRYSASEETSALQRRGGRGGERGAL